MKITQVIGGVALLCVLSGPNSVFGADSPAAPAVAPATPTAPTASVTPANAPGAGPRGGNRGAPMTPEEQAEVAKLAELPALSPDAGDEDYSIGPIYANAPEQTPRDGVPKGKVVKFSLDSSDSKFYSGISKTNPGAVIPYKRGVTVYIPSQYIPGTPAPFILTHDAQGSRNHQLPNILDNMIADLVGPGPTPR